MPERRPFVRLPADVYPVNYGLCLKPDLIDFTFEGKLDAQVEVRETGALWLQTETDLSEHGWDVVM